MSTYPTSGYVEAPIRSRHAPGLAAALPPKAAREPAGDLCPGPIVKWAGGKSRLLPQLLPLLPPGAPLMRHVEPFAGGAALFFARRPERALLCDVNPALIATYEAVRDEVEPVIEQLELLAARHSKQSYYQVRERYNRARSLSRQERAAAFIYLNKTCFNGLHRVNRRGEFNVPAGAYANPRIVNPAALRAASRELARATLRCDGFEGLLASARPGDFVYLDPPYEPVTSTANFTAYAEGGFGREDQLRLRDVCVELDRRGCRLMLSNSDVPFIRDLYQRFDLQVVLAPRAINRDGSKRGGVPELVVRNYA